MKNWMSRFALLAAIAGIMSSALVMGCGGGAEDDATANAGTNNAAATDNAASDAP